MASGASWLAYAPDGGWRSGLIAASAVALFHCRRGGRLQSYV